MSGWATLHIQRVKNGETISFRPKGNSMSPKIESGQLVTVAPILDLSLIQVGDIVLCSVKGQQFLHLVSAVQGNRFQISNNGGFTNGWTQNVYGKVIKIEP